MKRLTLFILTLILAFPTCAQTTDNLNDFNEPPSKFRGVIENYREDYGILNRFYSAQTSENRRVRFNKLNNDWLAVLNEQNFETLNHNEQVDYLLFKNYLEHEQREIERDARQFEEMSALIPFAKTIIDLEDSRRKLETVDAARIASLLNDLNQTIGQTQKNVDSGTLAKPKRTVANRAARTVGSLRNTLKNWFNFYNSYDPDFSWWNAETYKAVDASLANSDAITSAENIQTEEEKELITLAMWASEPIAFDPMEVALHNAYQNIIKADERSAYKMIHEYPLNGKPPMMTHIFENGEGRRIVAAKGAPEALMKITHLNEKEKRQIEQAIKIITTDGYRVLAVGDATFTGNKFPVLQQEFTFIFKGLVGFYDPPKNNIETVLQSFYNAGIAVKIITGDNAETTIAIAKQIVFRGYEKSISGAELMKLTDAELKDTVANTNIFTRMFPDAKLKIINALKANNEIVAMTGDGVNDGPALKAAHIGIAMGKKGTEIAKQAASLILVDDDLSRMVDAVAMGRKIYTKLKKAIQYIISIHIPIVLTVFVPLALGWIYPSIFTPVHIIFLELIIDRKSVV